MYGVAVPDLCREDRINDMIRCLDGFQIRVGPRCLRIGDLLHHVADEFIAEAGTKVRQEVLDPRVHSRPPLDPCRGESWERAVLGLDKGMLAGKGRTIR